MPIFIFASSRLTTDRNWQLIWPHVLHAYTPHLFYICFQFLSQITLVMPGESDQPIKCITHCVVHAALPSDFELFS